MLNRYFWDRHPARFLETKFKNVAVGPVMGLGTFLEISLHRSPSTLVRPLRMMKDVPYESKFDHFFLILELTTFELINLNLTACTTRAVNVRSIQMEYNASLGKT